MCLWLERGAHFSKNTKTKCMRAQISSKSHLRNCIFDARSHQDPSRILFFHLARQPLVFFENHKNQVRDRFGAAGRNAQGRWGEIWGGLEICRFEICNYGLVLSIWHASSCHTARAADSIASRIPPGHLQKPSFFHEFAVNSAFVNPTGENRPRRFRKWQREHRLRFWQILTFWWFWTHFDVF